MTHPLISDDIRIFFLMENSNFCYIKKCRYRLHLNKVYKFCFVILSLFLSKIAYSRPSESKGILR